MEILVLKTIREEKRNGADVILEMWWEYKEKWFAFFLLISLSNSREKSFYRLQPPVDAVTQEDIHEMSPKGKEEGNV